MRNKYLLTHSGFSTSHVESSSRIAFGVRSAVEFTTAMQWTAGLRNQHEDALRIKGGNGTKNRAARSSDLVEWRTQMRGPITNACFVKRRNMSTLGQHHLNNTPTHWTTTQPERPAQDTKLMRDPLMSVFCGPTLKALLGSLNCTTSKSITTFEESLSRLCWPC